MSSSSLTSRWRSLFILGLASLYHNPALCLYLRAVKWSLYVFHILESLGLMTLTMEMACVCESFE